MIPADTVKNLVLTLIQDLLADASSSDVRQGVVKVSLLVNGLTHSCRMYFPILSNWMRPFPFLRLLHGIFHFNSNFKRNFCKQTVENLVRRSVLLHLIWFCTVCLCPIKRTLSHARLNWVKEAYI